MWLDFEQIGKPDEIVTLCGQAGQDSKDHLMGVRRRWKA
jgi:hypothetical protein